MAIALHFIRWRSLFLYSFSPDFETALRARGTGNSPPKPPVHEGLGEQPTKPPVNGGLGGREQGLNTSGNWGLSGFEFGDKSIFEINS